MEENVQGAKVTDYEQIISIVMDKYVVHVFYSPDLNQSVWKEPPRRNHLHPRPVSNLTPELLPLWDQHGNQATHSPV